MGRRYQLPHFDRCDPAIRVGVRAGVTLAIEVARHGRDVPMDHDDLVRAAQKPAHPTLGDWANIPEDQYAGQARRMIETYEYPGWDDPRSREFTMSEMAACHLYDLYGRQVYTLSPLMQEMFEHTDLGAVTLADAAHMPFPCFYVSLGKTRHGIDGFYAYRTEDMITFVGVGFCGHTRPPDIDHGPEEHDCLNEVWPADTLNMPMADRADRESYLRYFFSVGLDDFSETLPVQKIISAFSQAAGTGGFAGAAWGEEGVPMMEDGMGLILNTFFNLLFFLNSDDRSVVSHDNDAERADAQDTIDRLKRPRGDRKRKRKRDAKQRLKYLSTARFHKVGVAQERDITSREGFDMDQPRHWRRGHFHRYWTGPLKLGGVKIPFDEWPDKRTIVRQWLIPTLVNPEGERVDVTTRTVVKESQEALADEILTEGKLKDHKQSRRERSPAARRKCLEHHGRICQLCFDDGSRFGEGAKGWLHVHHLDPLGDAVAEREVDPIADLVPVCGTCHGFLHSKRPPITMERAREIIEMAKAEKAAK